MVYKVYEVDIRQYLYYTERLKIEPPRNVTGNWSPKTDVMHCTVYLEQGYVRYRCSSNRFKGIYVLAIRAI